MFILPQHYVHLIYFVYNLCKLCVNSCLSLNACLSLAATHHVTFWLCPCPWWFGSKKWRLLPELKLRILLTPPEVNSLTRDCEMFRSLLHCHGGGTVTSVCLPAFREGYEQQAELATDTDISSCSAMPLTCRAPFSREVRQGESREVRHGVSREVRQGESREVRQGDSR